MYSLQDFERLNAISGDLEPGSWFEGLKRLSERFPEKDVSLAVRYIPLGDGVGGAVLLDSNRPLGVIKFLFTFTALWE